MTVVSIVQEQVAKIDGEELYVFPDRTFGAQIDARGKINASIRGGGLATVEAHTTKDRNGAFVYLNAFQIKKFEMVSLPVPTSITDQYDILANNPEESPEYLEAESVVKSYFSKP